MGLPTSLEFPVLPMQTYGHPQFVVGSVRLRDYAQRAAF